MTIGQLAELAEATIESGASVEGEILGGYTSDLLSDVMANAPTGAAFITIQAHKNTVAVAGLVGAAAIVICNSRPLPGDMLEAAARESIPVLSTGLSQFEVSGRLWRALHR